ncbi:MAG TPA: hypothetical protein VK541_10280 [Pedobacter sp.]|uniref:hypothetical protein n=1 Tax=Pedobacter sp. TaxID=1411316 RepID=UPI002C4C824A|nr:hypothetical protein [Pedobacter sp.]HMI02859.1 hypothetical protein [Pedobacter sp.]
MARSIRKTPIFGLTTAGSEKTDKRRWNRTFGRISKYKIVTKQDLPAKINAVTNVWDGNKRWERYWTFIATAAPNKNLKKTN